MLLCVQEVVPGEGISLECSIQCFPYPSFHYFELEKRHLSSLLSKKTNPLFYTLDLFLVFAFGDGNVSYRGSL